MIRIETDPKRMDTIELQELIPGIKLPRIPLPVRGLEELPIAPGVILRNARGDTLGANPINTSGMEKMRTDVFGQQPPRHASVLPEDEIITDTEGDIESFWHLDDEEGEFLQVGGVPDATNSERVDEDEDLIL